MSNHLHARQPIDGDFPPSEPEGPMLEKTRRVVAAASHLHRDLKGTADAVGTLLVDGFHLLALFLIGATTVWSAAAAFIGMVAQGHASLGDILLLFIYLEIGAMVGIYFKTTRLPVRYLMYNRDHRPRPRTDRNRGGGASDREGHPGGSGRDTAAVVRRLGAPIRFVQVSVG
jgi:Phosphate-starvation-inducible E family